METCPNCGERVYKLGCVNCDEEAYIAEQEMLTDYYGRDDPKPEERYEKVLTWVRAHLAVPPAPAARREP